MTMSRHSPQLIPTDVTRERKQRPFPLGYLSFADRTAARIQWLARSWIVIVTVGLALAAARIGVPSNPERGDWDVFAQLGLLIVAAVGALVAWRWEGVGATLIMLAAVGLGALSAAEYSLSRSFLLTIAFFVPSVLFWLVWQRTKSVWELGLLAGVLLVTLLVAGYAARDVYATYFGPVQPESAVALDSPEIAEWIWVGGTTDTSAVIKAALLPGTGEVQLLVSETEDLRDARSVESHFGPNEAESDIIEFSLDDLHPDTAYWYALAAGDDIDRSRPGQFRTFPNGPASFTFAFGACASTGSNGAVFDTIRAANPLFFLSTGDFFYENIDVNDPDKFRAAYDANLNAPAQSTLYRSTSFVYTWDDHDYGPNDSDRTAPGREAAVATYQAVVPHYPLGSGELAEQIYQAFTVGRVRVIVTDNYTERSPNAAPDNDAKTMLGSAQKAWLKRELVAANGNFPIIVWVNSQPWIAEAGPNAAGWGAYATERQELSNFITNHDIQGVVMLSGDAHMLAIDDGSNNAYASSGGPGFSVFHAAALDRHGGTKGGPYSEGTEPGGGQFGLMTVIDEGGDSIEIIWSGRNYQDEELMRYQFSVDASQNLASEPDQVVAGSLPFAALTDSPWQ
jgi:phosphodiesterase/alkaline phosphatase D-like protein